MVLLLLLNKRGILLYEYNMHFKIFPLFVALVVVTMHSVNTVCLFIFFCYQTIVSFYPVCFGECVCLCWGMEFI